MRAVSSLSSQAFASSPVSSFSDGSSPRNNIGGVAFRSLEQQHRQQGCLLRAESLFGTDMKYGNSDSSLCRQFSGAEDFQKARRKRNDPLIRRKGPQQSGRSKIVTAVNSIGSGFWEGPGSDDGGSFENDKFQSRRRMGKEKSVLLTMIQQIEPLDVSHISKDASPNGMDAMKRTISGMLGLLPSEQFQVSIEMEREPLARLLVSSMMTGYTLRNAEYRMCLQRVLEKPESSSSMEGQERSNPSVNAIRDSADRDGISDGERSATETESNDNEKDWVSKYFDVGSITSNNLSEHLKDLPKDLGDLTPEAVAYFQQLQAKMAAMTKELEDCKQTLAALEMDSTAAGDRNDVLGYLRSLDPDQVVELSQPTSPEVKEVIQQVIDGLLGRVGTSHSIFGSYGKGGGGMAANTWDPEGEANGTETDASPSSVGPAASAASGNVPLQFETTIRTSRDYLARLLFWCMLLGHHTRALEYRLELARTFSLSSSSISNNNNNGGFGVPYVSIHEDIN